MENMDKTNAPSTKEGTVVSGVVVEALPNTLFRVSIKDGEQEREILAYLAGKMRIHRIKVLVGDKVDVILDPYGGKGRITRRN
jgi:translation initiation factor IF-1